MKIRRRTPIAAVALVAAMAGALAVTVSTPPARAAATLLSQNKPATASSVENAGTPASAAVDGDTTTRWSYLPPDQLALIQNFKSQGVPVVVLLTKPRPYVITDWTGLADAIVVTYRGGEEVGPAAASPLFGDFVHCGRLPWQLPRSLDQVLVPGGRDVPADAAESWDLPYDLGATAAQRIDIRAHIDAGQTVPTTYGDSLYPHGWGLQGWH